ncbi:hypothetical protein RYA05_03210 [Pseudomonas syringae pv. actinidiae]|nr:hypothetical protein [Pseudomonas syringae pv. actinidiae]
MSGMLKMTRAKIIDKLVAKKTVDLQCSGCGGFHYGRNGITPCPFRE